MGRRKQVKLALGAIILAMLLTGCGAPQPTRRSANATASAATAGGGSR
jgi:outer membrane PBP1 activator LpoA protein